MREKSRSYTKKGSGRMPHNKNKRKQAFPMEGYFERYSHALTFTVAENNLKKMRVKAEKRMQRLVASTK